MGNSYVNVCCTEKGHVQANNINQIFSEVSDTPQMQFAAPVKSMIDVHPAIRELYHKLREMHSHTAEQKGTKLGLHYLFHYAAYYDGEWKNGLPHGQGIIIYDNGAVYEGCFKNGAAQCSHAIFVKENGGYFVGQVNKNRANGWGQLHQHQFIYAGEWVNDLPHGEGKEIYGEHSYYTGTFHQGCKHGEGKYYWNLNEFYEGEFQNNIFHGQGYLKKRNYNYKGTFQNGKRHGKGVLIMEKKWTYEGEFQDNMLHGKGTCTWEDGTTFSGNYYENKRLQGKYSKSQQKNVEILENQ